jgi:hypothetical protein
MPKDVKFFIDSKLQNQIVEHRSAISIQKEIAILWPFIAAMMKVPFLTQA